jgi:hypothetical protein
MEVDPSFLSFLQDEESRAYDGTLLQEVEAAINSYNGAEYGDEEDGRSQVVARDVAESADYMLTSIMDVMCASGRVVEFEPPSAEAEDQTDDATETMHQLYRRKSGYHLMHNWAKAGLIEKIGIVKTCVERKRRRVEREIPTELLPGETPEELKAAGIIEAEESAHDVYGQPVMHRVVTLEESAPEFPDYHVPLEEFLVAPDARDLDTAVYLCHLTEKSLSELKEMGLEVDGLPLSEGDSPFINSLSSAREDGRNNWLGVLDREGPNRKVWLREEYVLFDLNGDGISERLCVHRVGNTILKIDEVDYQPFEYWCPYPMQGRLIGQSLADKTMDIQRVNTVLERLMLDSGYQAVAPGTFISESAIGDHTLDDLLTIRPGRVVRFVGAVPPVPEQRPDIGGMALEMINFKRQQLENRTGITRLNKGVDEDTLNDTAKGQAMLMARGQQMERYIVRNFAEGVARLFMKKVGLMRKYAQPFQIRVDGEYRQVDPSQWPEDMEIQVTVGLGSGSKQDRIMYRQMVAQTHTLLMQGQAPICTWENVYNNLSAAAKDAGLAPNDIFTHPDDAPQQQQQPDPEMLKAMAEIQIGQMKLQQAQQEGQQKLQLMAQKHESDAAVAAYKAQMEADLAVRQQNLDMQLQQMEMKMEAQKHAHDIKLKEKESQAKVTGLRRGGALNK